MDNLDSQDCDGSTRTRRHQALAAATSTDTESVTRITTLSPTLYRHISTSARTSTVLEVPLENCSVAVRLMESMEVISAVISYAWDTITPGLAPLGARA